MSDMSFEIPPLIKQAVDGLNNDLRWKIIESIVNDGNLSYSQLMSRLHIQNNGILNFHLKILTKSALIERYEDLSSINADRSFYSISAIGKDIINGLMSAIVPQRKIFYFNDPEQVSTAVGKVGDYYVYQILEHESIPLTTSSVEKLPVPLAAAM